MHFQRFHLFLAILIALGGATNSFAQQRTAPSQKPSAEHSAQPILPDAFGTWQNSGCVADAQHAAVSQEAGEREFRQCKFSSGKQTATIWAGRYRDPSSAYEVYTSLLRTGMQPSTVGRFTAVDVKGLLILAGDIIVGVNEPRNVSTKDL